MMGKYITKDLPVVFLIVFLVALFASLEHLPEMREERVRARHGASVKVTRYAAEKMGKLPRERLADLQSKDAIPLSALFPYEQLCKDLSLPPGKLRKLSFFASVSDHSILVYRGSASEGLSLLRAAESQKDKYGTTACLLYDPTNGTDSSGTELVLVRRSDTLKPASTPADK